MRAAILSIGSELMLGQITDTNASWLARDLADAGIDLVQVTQVGDDRALMLRAMRNALEIADLAICTGGIGPTDDDLTREVISELVGETPEIDDTLLVELKAYFAELNRVMPERNAKQAWLIPSAEAVPNPVGTAPGWFVRIPDSDKVILTMPGVPREMYRMWAEQMKPRALHGSDRHIIDTVQIKTLDIGESDAEQRIHDLVTAGDPQVATYAKDDGVHIRVTAAGTDAEEVRARRDSARTEIYNRLGQNIWGEDEDTLAGVIARDLARRDLALAITEIGTGGAFASLLSADIASAGSFIRDTVLPMGAAATEADDDARTVDVMIDLKTEIDGSGVHHGTMRMRVSHESLAEPIEREWPLRAGLADVQRRVGLNAVYLLHNWLKQVES